MGSQEPNWYGMTGGKQFSPHQLLVYEVVRNASCWLTAKEIAQVPNQMVRHHAASLSDLAYSRR